MHNYNLNNDIKLYSYCRENNIKKIVCEPIDSFEEIT